MQNHPQNANELAKQIADRFSQLPEVDAIALAGSVAAGNSNPNSDPASDIDLYVYSDVEIPYDVHYPIAREFDDAVQFIDFWGPGLEWDDTATGIHVDLMFFSKAWMAEQVELAMVHHRARMGYSTAFLHTVRVSRPLYDPNGWFADLQTLANQPYPDTLAKNIIKQNYPVLREVYPSYRAQIAKAVSRTDIVSLNHRTVALLESYFDILFAVNRMAHPGEKRLIDIVEARCAKRPPHMRQHLTSIMGGIASADADMPDHIDALLDELDTLLEDEGLKPAPYA